MSLFGAKSPGLGPLPRGYFKDLLSSGGPSLSGKQSDKLSNLFGMALSSGADPSRLAFQASMLGSQFPGERSFQPGGNVYNQLFGERFGPPSKKKSIADANFMSQQIFGRPLTGDERSWIRSERPDANKIAGLFYSSPEAMLAASPTAEEDKLSAYYGRMVPQRSKSGGVQFTGKRFSDIPSVEYTGGIG
jgi:hypothetical protein